MEDRFQVTDTLILSLGLRRESFKNKNNDGQTFLESKGFYSPRVSGSWDIHGDASLKVFGSAGRYSLQLPTKVATPASTR